MKFLDLNFLYISKVQAFLDYILSIDKAQDKIKSKKTFQKLYNTANQNNSVINLVITVFWTPCIFIYKVFKS